MKLSNPLPALQYKHQALAPPIPMERPTPKTYSKTDSLTFKLKSTPGQNESSTYEITVPYFSSGTSEDLIEFFWKVDEVYKGQNIATARDKFSLIHRLLSGDVRSHKRQTCFMGVILIS